MTIDEMLAASKGATFSECKKYRFSLWRIWEFHKPTVMFICLNPSTANDVKDDPTIRRVIDLSKTWGYGGMYMTNLFPYITPYPAELEKTTAAMIKENDSYIANIAKSCKEIIFAWGAFPVMGRDVQMIKKFPNAKALVVNDDGTPRHPLYVPKNTTPVLYTPVL